MFGLFKSEPFRDGQLGEFRRSGGYWKGSLVVAPCGTFRLALAGSREAPDPIALGLAKELPDRFKSLMPKIDGVTPEDVDQIVKYVRWLQRQAGIQ